MREVSQKNLGPGTKLQTPRGGGVIVTSRELENLHRSLCENGLNSKQKALQSIGYIFTQEQLLKEYFDIVYFPNY